jgi:hypothetical protein
MLHKLQILRKLEKLDLPSRAAFSQGPTSIPDRYISGILPIVIAFMIYDSPFDLPQFRSY